MIEKVLRKKRHHVVLSCVYIVRYKGLLSISFLVIDLINFEFAKLLLREVQELALRAIRRKLKKIIRGKNLTLARSKATVSLVLL